MDYLHPNSTWSVNIAPTFHSKVYVEVGLLVTFLLAAQHDQTLTQRRGGIAELRGGQVVQQLRPQHLKTTKYTISF